MALALGCTCGIDPEAECRVYFNLHKKVFSVQQRGKVVAHLPRLVLTGVAFRVNQAGRERAVREKRRNVHAFAVGRWSEDLEAARLARRVRYNPFERAEFFDAETGEGVTEAPFVLFAGSRAYA